MIKIGIQTLFYFFLLVMSAQMARAQRVVNRAALQKASQEIALQEKAMHVKLMALAEQKKWPLTLRNQKGRLAYLMSVDANGAPVYVSTTDNIISAATIGTNTLWPGGSTGLSLNGSSATLKGKIAVWDEGEVRPTHVELIGRVTQVDGNTTISDHSTHVAGTLIAAGVNPLAKGMSFGAQQLMCYDFNNDVSEMFAASSSLLISSHSYATIAGWFQDATENNRWEWFGTTGDTVDYKFGEYDTQTQLWDSIAYDAPNYLIVKAGGNNRAGSNGPAVGQDYWGINSSGQFFDAGARPSNISSNAGYDIIATYGVAKNILTLGAVNPIPGGYSQPSDVVLADFSSWGPSNDGRIKPDVVADGINVLSSVGSADNAYDVFSGTSMATPAAGGSAFLLQEYYSKLHGQFMLSSTLRGLIIHTADEAGPSPGPDYQYGWGLIDMKKAASVITSDTSAIRDQMIEENQLVNGSHDADAINVVASGKTPLIATIAWIDPPATPSTSVHVDTTRKLVNDLDIRITDGTNTFKPWVLNPYNRPAAATTGDNYRDNVEKIEVDSLIPGKAYTISVTHKGSLARGSQTYSLLVSGVGGTAYCTSASGGTGTRIDNVTLANINNTNSAGCKSYSDFTAVAAGLLPVGQSVPFSVSYHNCNNATTTVSLAIYIDFNNNGNFTDAGELVAQTTGLTSTGTTATWNGNIAVPSGSVGNFTRMRIVAEDISSTPAPCGSYASGETQDYRVLFTNPTSDVGVTELAVPNLTSCANDSQVVAVHIRNFGTTAQTNTPVMTIITSGATTVATLTGVCRDSIAPGSEVVYTYNTTFPSVAGTTYSFTSLTSLAGDLNTSNNTSVTTITMSPAAASPTATATICSSAPGSSQAILKANATGDDIAFWYAAANATTPIASGNITSTTVIPANDTYYVGLNDLSGKLGPSSNVAITSGAGAYFGFSGNYINLTTSVPLTIESARMYIGYPGKISLTLGTLISSSFLTGSFFLIPIYNTTIDVAATVSNPKPGQVNVAAGANTDTGALYYLNIPVPTPGNYVIVLDTVAGQTAATAFLNVSSTPLPYPFTLPGVISITGNNLFDGTLADTLTFPKKVYFPFYDIGISVSGCPGPRIPVVATTPTPPTISLNGDVFTSSVANGNQWYRTSTLIPGATNQTDTAIYSGVYKTIVSDPSGCLLTSDSINFTSTAVVNVSPSAIDLIASPNPNPGVFQLQFTMLTQDNLSISLINMVGQRVYEESYPDFVGQFSKSIAVTDLASGLYILQIQHGNDVYTKKILIKK